MIITRRHPFTGQFHQREIDVTEAQIYAWQSGELIQNAMPNLSADDREFILTGITDFDDIFKDEIGVLPEDPEESAAADNDGVPVQKEKQYSPPSKKIYSTKNFRADRLRQLRPTLKYLSPQVILAGGSLRTVLNCGNEEVSDFDLFFTSFQVVPELRERLIQDGWILVFSCPEEKLFTYKKGKHKLQLICETEYLGAENLISAFDVNACCASLHEGVIYFTREFVRGVYSKKLRINNVTFPVATIKRLVKYSNKGYYVSKAAEDFMREVEGKTFDPDSFRQYID